MSSIKIILFKGKTYSDGSHPIMLQYTDRGKVKRKVVHRCQLSDWDAKNERVKGKSSNAAYINSYLAETYSEAERQHLKLLNGESNSISFFETDNDITVGEAIDKELSRLQELVKPTAYNHLAGYKLQMGELVQKRVSHANITWFNSLIDTFKKLGNSPATLEKKVKHIRRIIAKYSDSDLSKEVKELRIPITKPLKQKLNALELTKIIELELEANTNIAIARDIFLLQIYLRGVRIGDILQATNDQFMDGRFTYISEKTGKEMGIKLVPQAVTIIDKYRGKYEKLFPFFIWKNNPQLSKYENEKNRLKHKESCTTMVNSNLKKIAGKISLNKPLSTHIARHTFARLAIDKINNPMITMELLGHSSLTVHQQYLKDIRKDDVLDQATDEIFG